ncbi:unnamed protein product [Polarella glacialis]|uniref:peptidylprolyl isomerase n=1 Tax=Polarella glacialis TaxID=89957 RepID=A0A813GRH3_POLGL|nr:unnamed protein product [Polarella glacialis]CAE8629609.1 unnamed protein product [Polarella glacialis]
MPIDIGISEADLEKRGYILHTTKPGAAGGVKPTEGKKIVMSYKGMLVDGTVFDQSERFETLIGVGAVIGGWDKGVMEMTVGQEGRLVCHHTHAYGADGDPTPPAIPPFATLVFDVKLLNIL